jgi:hypothetical protein
MRFEYLVLADAANRGVDGKINVLGLGVRILSYPSLPAASPLAIVGAVEAAVDEAGDYALLVKLVEPDGTVEEIVKASAKVPSEVSDERVPTGIGFTIGLTRPFRLEGIHSIRASFGDQQASFAFVVRLVDAEASSTKETT